MSKEWRVWERINIRMNWNIYWLYKIIVIMFDGWENICTIKLRVGKKIEVKES